MTKLIGNRSFVEFVDSAFEDIQVYRFPDGHRPYNEIAVFGRKRKTELPLDAIQKHGELHQRDWQWRGYVRIEELPQLGELQPKYWTNGKPSYEREEEPARMGDSARLEATHVQEDDVHR